MIGAYPLASAPLAASSRQQQTATPSFFSASGSSAVSLLGNAIISGSLSFQGASSFAPQGKGTAQTRVGFSGSGQLALASNLIVSRSLAITGSGNFSAIGRRTVKSSVSLNGSSVFFVRPVPPPAPPADPADAATIDMGLVPVDAKRTDWPRLVANAINALIKQYRVTVKNPFMQLDTAPFDPVEGQTYYDTTTHQVRVYNGTTWVSL